MSTSTNSVEAWVLMSLVYKDIDDLDYHNALALSERLYAIDKSNEDYLLIYGKCLYLIHDYNGSHDVLKNTASIPCRYLFARSCLELGKLSNNYEKSTIFWREGVISLLTAIKEAKEKEKEHYWGDDLCSVTYRSHIPSIASMTGLLGELYIKLENIRASAMQLWDSLAYNPFKITIFTKICDIAPDIADMKTASASLEVFKKFNTNNINLRRSPNPHYPTHPSIDSTNGITVKPEKESSSLNKSPVPYTYSSNTAAVVSNSLLSTNDHNPFLVHHHQNSFLPHPFNISAVDPSTMGQLTSSIMTDSNIPSKLQPHMPALRSHNNNISLDQLKALVQLSNQTDPLDIDFDEPERGDIEIHKDQIIDNVKDDIEEMKRNEAFKNKHGLHKKPPTETSHELSVELSPNNATLLFDDPSFYDSKSDYGSPPRLIDTNYEKKSPLIKQKKLDDNDSLESIKSRLRNVKRQSNGSLDTQPPPAKKQATMTAATSIEIAATRQKNSVARYFIPSLIGSSSSSSSSIPINANISYSENDTLLSEPLTKEIEDLIIDAMNKVICVLKTLASAYMYQSSYYCREAAMELQKLDNNQYDTASVLCILGQAYYDSADYPIARVFFHRAFTIAPWYCQGVPSYSTCLWYLDYEDELNLLAFKMRDNYTHQYESYIAAGNWTKCSRRGNETVKWFQKAVELDPRRYYGHTLLGYEEWEKGNYLGAKQHFAQAMMANKRAYLGWYGAGLSYKDMHEFVQAKNLLAEAIRLHPRHPTLLDTMDAIEKAIAESNHSN